MGKKEAYRLQTLFGIREREKEEAEEVYAQAMKALQKIQEEHAQMESHLKTMVFAREERREGYAEKTRQGELTIDQIRANDRHIDRLKAEESAYQVQIHRHQEEVDEVAHVAEEKKKLMVEATQAFKALEKHKEKWIKEKKREAMLKAEMTAEDISQAQYFSRLVESKEKKRG